MSTRHMKMYGRMVSFAATLILGLLLVPVFTADRVGVAFGLWAGIGVTVYCIINIGMWAAIHDELDKREKKELAERERWAAQVLRDAERAKTPIPPPPPVRAYWSDS